jgi:hypothetical protein
MYRLSLLASLVLLNACASPVPPHDPGHAWVELSTTASDLLMADDGRYFQVPPGSHELLARFQFEVPGGGGGNIMSSEPEQRTCEIRVRYADFAAGQRYRLEARPLVSKAQAWLYDDQRNVLARGRVLRCGTF